eukprot:gnl/TRDRNA2_/TRDRNA2_156529_c2_seq1.p2 gnl/TRDRNA2_/TRDRNA2_156529_c2~~gnl/TRDRNA2_/TRDRNA2_156529_c2_seq1.p2  ORF type:complete len:104 (-),score=6.67 gnl/TRDRNA2_/TRDRNA2_156529_c2_seq1:29-340(-)
MVAKSRMFNSPVLLYTTVASDANMMPSNCATIVKAQAMLLRFCELSSQTRRSAAFAKSTSNLSCLLPTIARAQAVLERACALKSLVLPSATRANAVNTFLFEW